MSGQTSDISIASGINGDPARLRIAAAGKVSGIKQVSPISVELGNKNRVIVGGRGGLKSPGRGGETAAESGPCNIGVTGGINSDTRWGKLDAASTTKISRVN